MYCKMAQDGWPSSQLLRTIYIYFFYILVIMNLIGTLGHPVSVTHKLPASQDSKQLRHTRKSLKNACVQAKRYVLCH